MKALVIFYSRTGNTRIVATQLRALLGAELVELAERTDRRGLLGYLRAGRDALFQRRAEIAPLQVDASNFELVVVGTPVWNYSVSSPVRTFLEEYASMLRSVAFFCTMGGGGSARVFGQMERACGKPPIATLALTERQISSGELSASLQRFASQLAPRTTTEEHQPSPLQP